MQHVIIGAGPAGVVAAEAIRKYDVSSTVTLVGEEPERPYSRMAIPYFLIGQIEEGGTHLRKSPEHFAARGIDIVAITDSPLPPLVVLTDTWCELDVPAIGPFDSSIPAVTIAELLVSQVARTLHDEATERIDRIEALWEATDTYVQAD